MESIIITVPPSDRGDDPPEDEQPLGYDELGDRGDQDEGGQRRRPAVYDRGDAEGDGERGGEHWRDGAGADRSEAPDLE